MTTEEVSQRLEAIPDDLTGSDWGFAFLKCFQGKDSKLPKSTFDRVKDGSTNYANHPDTEILWKKRIYFRWVTKDIRTALLEAKASPALRRPVNKPMFLVIASPDEIAAHDLDEGEDLVIIESGLRWISGHVGTLQWQRTLLVGSVTFLSAMVKNIGALAMLMPAALRVLKDYFCAA